MIKELQKEQVIISDFLRSIGPWHNHIVIGGGYAPIIYKLYLAEQELKYPPVGTRDLDSLIPRKIPNTPVKNIDEFLRNAEFKLVFKDNENPATESYVKEIEGTEIEIEFLTDASIRNNKHQNVFIAGIVAQPLSYLKLSIESAISFKTQSKETGLVVSPGAWIFHKGLTFPRRHTEQKIFKDLYGIWYVTMQLGKLSDGAITELINLSHLYPKWNQTFCTNLRKWTENATPFDWIRLEAQDPFGRLKKISFERIIEKLLG